MLYRFCMRTIVGIPAVLLERFQSYYARVRSTLCPRSLRNTGSGSCFPGYTCSGIALSIFVLSAFCGATLQGTAQENPSPRAARLAYQEEMAEIGHDCPNQVDLLDRNECLDGVRDQTYKNFDTFFDGLREALIDASPNDANALALDAAERAWEKGRTATCDAVSNMYDVGTVKHPGTTQPSARTRCLIQLTRSRMRDLMQLYGSTL